MRPLLVKVANLSTSLVTLSIITILIFGSVVLQFTSWKPLYFDEVFRSFQLLVLLQLLCIMILIQEKIESIMSPAYFRYIDPPNAPNPSKTANLVGASSIYICATSLGRTGKMITDILDRTNANVCVFCSPPRLPFLVESQIEESIGQLKHFLKIYGENPRLHIYTTNNPGTIGFLAFCDKINNIKKCFIHWYTFNNGFLTQRGRGLNGTLVIEKGINQEADSLIFRIQEIISEKLNDSSLKELRTLDDLEEVILDEQKCLKCDCFILHNKKFQVPNNIMKTDQ